MVMTRVMIQLARMTATLMQIPRIRNLVGVAEGRLVVDKEEQQGPKI